MKLSIVIPAYNEEAAIASIIERTLAARESIIAESPVRAVEIIVVSDGSTDRTAKIAAGYEEIELLAYETNRGYGAAIKTGFEQASGELLGFLDADGTCDPSFFARLCRAIVEDDADVAIGSRMHAGSRMPRVRRLGNRMYALMLSALSNRIVTDTASGMRVIRREALEAMYPLPDGLHFTPAMSARILMGNRLKIVERPMPYEERVGESKLSVVRDGVRFLRTILGMTMHWRPGRVFVSAAVLCATVMILFALHPIEMWLTQRRLQEDMIYRLLLCSLMGTLSATLLSAGITCEHLGRLLDGRNGPVTFGGSLLDGLYSRRGFVVGMVVATPALIWLVGPGVVNWLTAGVVTQHWSRVVLAGMVVFCLTQLGITALIVNVIRFHASRGRLLAGQVVREGQCCAEDKPRPIAREARERIALPSILTAD